MRELEVEAEAEGALVRAVVVRAAGALETCAAGLADAAGAGDALGCGSGGRAWTTGSCTFTRTAFDGTGDGAVTGEVVGWTGD